MPYKSYDNGPYHSSKKLYLVNHMQSQFNVISYDALTACINIYRVVIKHLSFIILDFNFLSDLFYILQYEFKHLFVNI